MVREIVLGLVFMLTVFGSEARTGVELNERTSVSTPAAKTTSPPQQDSSRLSGVGKVAGLGEFKVALLWDNRVKVAMTTSEAVSTFACVSTAPRGITSTAAVEITAKGSSADTSAAGGGAPSLYKPDSALKPGAGASPNWYQCATVRCVRGHSPTTGSVDASATIIFGAARSSTRSTSGAVSRQLMGYAMTPWRAHAPYRST